MADPSGPLEEREILTLAYPPDLPGVSIIRAVNNSTKWQMHHEMYLIYLMHDGGGAWTCDGRTYPAVAGQTGFMSPGDYHKVTSLAPCGITGEPGTTQDCVQVSPELVLQAGLELGVGPSDLGLRAGVSADPRVSSVFRRYFLQCLDAPRSPLALQSAFAECMETLVARIMRPSVDVLRTSAGQRAVRRCKDYLRSESGKQVTLDELSALTGYSKFHLLRAFKAELGITPHQFLIQVRLAKARQLLTRGVPPALVAADVGFADQAHFIRLFKRWMGVPPVRTRSKER